MTQPVQYFDAQGSCKELRLRINTLEEEVAQLQTKVSGVITVASLAVAAIMIELASKFMG